MTEPSIPPHERSATRTRCWCAHASMRHMPRLVPKNTTFFPNGRPSARNATPMGPVGHRNRTLARGGMERERPSPGRRNNGAQGPQLKRRRSLSPDARSGKRQRCLPQSPSVVELTCSPDRAHEDAPFIQLTGSPIRELHW